MKNMINIIFPMAGEGSRFGYDFKPFLPLADLTFIEKAIEPFVKHIDSIKKFYFVVTKTQEEKYGVRERLELILDVPFEVIIIPEKTEGPYQTIKNAIAANPQIKEHPGVICDCDHSIDVDYIFANYETSECIIPIWNISEEEQEQWSKIIYHGGKINMVCEKETLSSPDFDIYGIIGCTFFNSFKEFEGEGTYISDAIKKELGKLSIIKTYFPNHASFFGDPSRLEKYKEEQSKKMTFFLDFDGTLIKHESTPDHDSSPTDVEVLVDTKKLLELQQEGNKIIVTTARAKKNKESVIKILEENDIPYDDIVLGCNSGPRILVNDVKPRSPFVQMAHAINLKRDAGFVVPESKDFLLESGNAVHSQLGGFSPADKYVIKGTDKTFVRKIIYKTSKNKYHVDKLKIQVENLKRQYFLWEGSTPIIYNEFENENWYYYDMEYLNPDEGWELLEKSNDKVTHISNLLSFMASNIYCLRRPIDGVSWLKKHIEEKINPKLASTSLKIWGNEELERIFICDDLIINGRKTKSLRQYINEIDSLSFMPKWISPIHGDLTFENILVNSNTKNIKTIDPDGSEVYDAPELELGKMCQSLKMKYSSWEDSDWELQDGNYIINQRFFDNRDSAEYKTLISAWADILVENLNHVKKKAIFFAVLHLIRLIPFKLEKNKNHAILAALLARYWMSEITQKNIGK